MDVFNYAGFNYIIDGHHRAESALRLGINVPVNFLSSPRGFANVFELQIAAQKTESGKFKVDGRYLKSLLPKK